MNSLIETLNHWGGNLGCNAWPMLWQSSLLIVAVLVFDFLLRRQLRASIRYALWLVVLVKLILPPTLALPTSPAWWIHKTPPPSTVKTTVPKFTVTYDQSLLPEMTTASLPVFVPVKPVLTLAAWLLIASISASVLLFAWLLARWWQITRQVRRATISPYLIGLADDVKRRAAMKFKSPPVKLTANTMSPAVCGLFHPVILIPQSLATEFSDEQMRAVLLHELIHLQRRDVWVNFLQSLLQMVYWWHPLVWVANARIRRVREEAVDDAVMLTPGGTAEIYAPTLLEVAKLALNRPLASLGLVGILESRSALRQRIERLINFNAPRKAGLTVVSLLGILVFSAVAVPMGEGPEAAPMLSMSTNGPEPELQSLTLQVDPAVFKQNVKAHVWQTMHAATDECTDIVIDLLRGEGVDCAPPHVFIFDLEAGKLTAKNSPDELEIFRQVIEQLNRPDGKCQLPLSKTSFQRQPVLIIGRIYALSPADIKQVTQGLDLEKGLSKNSSIGIIAADHFAAFNHKIESLGITPLSRPSVLTRHGMTAQLFISSNHGMKGTDVNTNGIEFDCCPYVGDKTIELAFSASGNGEWFGDNPVFTSAMPHYASGRVTTEDQGGIVVCANDPNGSNPSNLLMVIGVQIMRNANLHFGQRLNTIINKSDGTMVTNIVDTTATNAGILSNLQFAAAASLLQGHGGAKTLAEPTVITTKVSERVNVLNASAVSMVSNQLTRATLDTKTNVVFSVKDSDSHPLFMRSFKLDKAVLMSDLRERTGMPVDTATNIAAAARSYFAKLGVDLESPKGKEVFFNERLSLLFVKATEADLDIIEHAMQLMAQVAPQVHIKARFFEAPKGTLDRLAKIIALTNPLATSNQVADTIGVLTAEDFKTVLHELQVKSGTETLSEPEAATTSGQHMQMLATEVITVITNFTRQVTATNWFMAPQVCQVETGSILDATANVLSDGYTIDLKATALFSRLPPVSVPMKSPFVTVARANAHIKLLDGQTMLLGKFEAGTVRMENLPSSLSKKIFKTDITFAGAAKPAKKELLVFVTATIVDPAGNRVHKDDEMAHADFYDDVAPHRTF